MICPRCSLDDVPATAEACPRCGFTLLGAEPAPKAVSEELERALRRDLGGQYEIAELLGRGGMSLVYLAYEIELSRPVALKILPLQFIHDPDTARRFEREAKIAAALDHPHIVPIFRVGATGTFLWYAMKYIKGRSLAEVIEHAGPVPLEDCLKIVEQVASALHYAHRHGVVHRDIKPANVMMDDSGWALVCDFGVARAFGSVALTRTGGSLGTPRYMSPEQFEGQQADGRSDQYSLAILTYEALAGTVPFSGDSLGELIRKHLLEPAPRLADVKPDVPVPVSDALVRAMSKKPGDRFADIAEFVQALGGRAVPRAPAAFRTSPTPATRALGERLDDSDPSVPVAPARARRARAWLAAGGGGALLAAGAVWAVLQSGNAGVAGPPVNPPTRDTSATHATSSDSTTTRKPTQGGGAAIRPTGEAARVPPPRREPVAPPVTPGTLGVSTEAEGPWGEVFVDGRSIGNTPRTNVPLAPGRRRIRVARDGYVPFDTTVIVAPGQAIKLLRIRLREVRP
ncbi:MAG: serine/threonine-protein kinase [Gemmatimonadales bacterium]